MSILDTMKKGVAKAGAGAKSAAESAKSIVADRRADRQTGELIVALDIGTEFVKALIARIVDPEPEQTKKHFVTSKRQEDEVKSPTSAQLEIIGVGLKRQAPSDMHHGAIADISGVVKSCEEALTEAEDQAGLQTQKAIVGIAGELVKGNTNTIRYRRPNPDQPLDAEEMDFIIEKVQDRAKDRARDQVALETNNPDVEVKLVNSALVSIHIDGYKVSNPIGFQGKDVAVQIYTAFAPMVHIGAIERVCDELDLDLIAVAAEPFAVSRSVIGDDVASNFTAILMDVGGGTTDMAVVDDGGVEGTKMFGIGGRTGQRTHQARSPAKTRRGPRQSDRCLGFRSSIGTRGVAESRELAQQNPTLWRRR